MPRRSASMPRSTPARDRQGDRREARARPRPSLLGGRNGDVWMSTALTAGAARDGAGRGDRALPARSPQVAAVLHRAREIAAHADAGRPARDLDAARARPRLVRSDALGRPAGALKPRVTPIPDPDHGLCRDARQPLGLRPPRADAVLAQGHDRVRTAAVGRDGRHRADARGDDRVAAARRRRPLPRPRRGGRACR